MNTLLVLFVAFARWIGFDIGKKKDAPAPKIILKIAAHAPTTEPVHAKKAKSGKLVRAIRDTHCLPAVVVSRHANGRPHKAEHATRSGFSCRARVQAIQGGKIVLVDKHGTVFRRTLATVTAVA